MPNSATVTLAEESVPTGACGWVMFGSGSTAARSAFSASFSSASNPATCSFSLVLSSFSLARSSGVALLNPAVIWFCLALVSSTCRWAFLRASSARTTASTSAVTLRLRQLAFTASRWSRTNAGVEHGEGFRGQ